MFFTDRRVMQPRLTSLRASLAGCVGAVAVALLIVAGLGLADAPKGVIAVTALVLVAASAALVDWVRRRIEGHLRGLSANAERMARGETVSVAAGIREGEELARFLGEIGETLQRRAAEVEESRERYQALAEGLPALVWIMTQDGRTAFQNGRVAQYTGGSLPADQAARNEFVHPDDLPLIDAARTRSAREVKEYQMEIRLRRQDGVYRWHLVTTAPLSFPIVDHDRTDWLSTAIDIEDLKQAEELQARLASVLEKRVAEATQQLRDETAVRQKAERQLRQTQKMEAISRLTGGIAHDLNNKLMVISANIDAVTKHIKEQPQLRRKLLAALVAADQAAALMSKLLAFARQRDLQVQYIDIAEHLDSITSLLDRSFLSDSVEVRLSIPEDLWPVEVDPHELETAIVNLAVNARDAMPRGGAISIEARNVRVRKGSMSDPDLAGEFVQIVISDTGEGIAPQHLEHVFEPFFTTKEATRASGLGLSQVHGFAEQLGGTVDVSSTVGVGTSVALYLPRAEMPARLGSKPDIEDLTDDEEQEKAAAEIL